MKLSGFQKAPITYWFVLIKYPFSLLFLIHLFSRHFFFSWMKKFYDLNYDGYLRKCSMYLLVASIKSHETATLFHSP